MDTGELAVLSDKVAIFVLFGTSGVFPCCSLDDLTLLHVLFKCSGAEKVLVVALDQLYHPVQFFFKLKLCLSSLLHRRIARTSFKVRGVLLMMRILKLLSAFSA